MSARSCTLRRPRFLRFLGISFTIGPALVVGLATTASAATDTRPPSTPGNLRVAGTTDTSITVAWTASTDDTGVTSYGVYRDGQRVKTVPGGSTSATDKPLWPHSTHTYYVVAVDGAGNQSNPSSIVTASTKADSTPPTPPADVTGRFEVAKRTVALAWQASTDDVAVDHYDIYRNLTKIASTPAGTLTYDDTTAPINAVVKYLVEAVDEFSNSSNSSNQPQVITDTEAPTPPADLHVTSTNSSWVSIAWTSATDNFGVTKYVVFCDGTRLDAQSANSPNTYVIGSLGAGTTHTFEVFARDATGNRSAGSNVASATLG